MTIINHPCPICGDFGPYGFTTRQRGPDGRAEIEWYCKGHRDIGVSRWKAGDPAAVKESATEAQGRLL
jgi:hypothetical protein